MPSLASSGRRYVLTEIGWLPWTHIVWCFSWAKKFTGLTGSVVKRTFTGSATEPLAKRPSTKQGCGVLVKVLLWVSAVGHVTKP